MTRGAPEPCVFCGLPTVVRVAVVVHDRPGEPESERRICVHCFKAIVEHMTQKP